MYQLVCGNAFQSSMHKGAFAKVSEIMKGNKLKSINVCSFGETQNPAGQMYFCINLETVGMLFNLSDTTVAFNLSDATVAFVLY